MISKIKTKCYIFWKNNFSKKQTLTYNCPVNWKLIGNFLLSIGDLIYETLFFDKQQLLDACLLK